MNFEKSTIEDLQAHERRVAAIQNLRERIRALEEEAVTLSSSSTDGEAVLGAHGDADDRLVDNIAERGRLHTALDVAQTLVRVMERGLSMLTIEERTVLHHFFIHRAPGYMDTLCETLGYEERQIYRIKDNALKHLTLCLYGVEAL